MGHFCRQLSGRARDVASLAAVAQRANGVHAKRSCEGRRRAGASAAARQQRRDAQLRWRRRSRTMSVAVRERRHPCRSRLRGPAEAGQAASVPPRAMAARQRSAAQAMVGDASISVARAARGSRRKIPIASPPNVPIRLSRMMSSRRRAWPPRRIGNRQTILVKSRLSSPARRQPPRARSEAAKIRRRAKRPVQAQPAPQSRSPRQAMRAGPRRFRRAGDPGPAIATRTGCRRGCRQPGTCGLDALSRGRRRSSAPERLVIADRCHTAGSLRVASG